MKFINKKSIFPLLILGLVSSCQKSSNTPIPIEPVIPTQEVSVIVLLGDGMGIPQITASWHEHDFLNLQRFPYTGLTLTHTVDKIITESGAGSTALFTGVKTKYGYQGMGPQGQNLESLYNYLKQEDYLTGIISTSFLTDATLAALYRHGNDRYDYENIAFDYSHHYADFTIAGGQDHFDNRSDQINLIDSLKSQGVQIFYGNDAISGVQHLPSIGFMDPLRPPYILDGRADFLKNGSLKALDLFKNEPFFLFIEGALVDLAGHDESIENQVSETLEFDEVAGLMLDYAEQNENVLIVVVSDHESGALTLLQGDGMNYIPNYAIDEHSGGMVPVFAYGPGAENFTGMMDNSDIYYKIKNIIDQNLSK
ncbi:alkaline phosphatase [Lentimicrobium sp. S6]|uniref:alkaline phosphatase n=1 Tax=Lentimicrobium sp. S6 TaxID=2735872 RepID=UPI001554142E|nr:alkaline phosphatase [Lentimicrobium sp. S6]NPD47568.1 alkaline phosphatase [Lentimicrobium sp. S6]